MEEKNEAINFDLEISTSLGKSLPGQKKKAPSSSSSALLMRASEANKEERHYFVEISLKYLSRVLCVMLTMDGTALKGKHVMLSLP